MPTVRFRAASEHEISLVSDALEKAGYVVTKMSSREFEFDLPVLPELDRPEPQAQEVMILQDGQEVDLRDAAQTEERPIPVEQETLRREFILAPSFRSFADWLLDLVTESARHLRTAWSAAGRRFAVARRKLAHVFPFSLRAIGRHFVYWEEGLSRRPAMSALAKYRELRTTKRKEILAVSAKTADRVGWVLVAIATAATLVAVVLGLYSGRPDQVSQTKRPREIPLQAATSSGNTAVAAKEPALEGKPVATHERHRKAAVINHDANEVPDVIVRHFTPKQPQPRLQQVAGVKHFSDMEQ